MLSDVQPEKPEFVGSQFIDVVAAVENRGIQDAGDRGAGQAGAAFRRVHHLTLAGKFMFVLGWRKLGLEQRLGTRLVTYADFLVILCRRGNAEAVLHHLRTIVGKLKLTENKHASERCRKGSSTF
ncbi:hypothetical protein [Sinorhizobium saheli]|uniref:Uncharacterized protein n=1 Tax=Sinorhizobium saheli TaxID=36856 RepID=A0A178XP18_SINSA|nr:hypothetical protein [Sinorhizobium saheli]MQW90361.1 hypothetical protein [Sinorhizobium saheli]OAP37010.1 hypothetical protein ATB98_21885 [Sinorhizobium saheli]